MPDYLNSGIARRIASLVTAGAIALGGAVLLAPSASADDYERTPDEVIAQLEAQVWPNYSIDNPGPSVDILAAQYFLNALGYVTASPSEDFTEEFDEVLRTFEREEGITEDGVLESQSWIKIRNMHFPTEADSYQRGDRGYGVLAIKVLLNKKFDAGLSLTSSYDAATENAVEAAQRELGLADDGAFGRLSYKAVIIYRDYEERAATEQAPVAEAPAEEAPVAEAPAEEAPVAEAPAEDAEQTDELEAVRGH